MLSWLMNSCSATAGKAAAATPVPLATKNADERLIGVPELVKQAPSLETKEVIEYTEKTSYAVGEVLEFQVNNISKWI